jgi:hypothetical protein
MVAEGLTKQAKWQTTQIYHPRLTASASHSAFFGVGSKLGAFRASNVAGGFFCGLRKWTLLSTDSGRQLSGREIRNENTPYKKKSPRRLAGLQGRDSRDRNK